MIYLFVDFNKYFLDYLKSLDWSFLNPDDEIYIKHDDIRTIKTKNTVIISAANSFGSMGGGVDLIYDRYMFPNISKTIMNRIKKYSPYENKSKPGFDKLNKNLKYIPVGSALITTIDKTTNTHIITAPTMFTPMDVRGTNNAYKAYIASLQVLEKSGIKVDVLVCTGLGTGVGLMPFNESADQMYKAIKDFYNDKRVSDCSKYNELVLFPAERV